MGIKFTDDKDQKDWDAAVQMMCDGLDGDTGEGWVRGTPDEVQAEWTQEEARAFLDCMASLE
jgi:hypothetical protein